MLTSIRPAVVMIALFTALLGVAYALRLGLNLIPAVFTRV